MLNIGLDIEVAIKESDRGDWSLAQENQLPPVYKAKDYIKDRARLNLEKPKAFDEMEEVQGDPNEDKK